MPDYRYELRRGDEVVATGHLSREQSLEVGERIAIGSHTGVVRAVEPLLHERELRLVVQLWRDDQSVAARTKPPSVAPAIERDGTPQNE